MKAFFTTLILFLALTSKSLNADHHFTVPDIYKSVVKITADKNTFSGVILDSSGLILTGNTFLQNAKEIVVTFNNEDMTTAILHSQDRISGVALIKAQGTFTAKGVELSMDQVEAETGVAFMPYKKSDSKLVTVKKVGNHVGGNLTMIKDAIFTTPVVTEAVGTPVYTGDGKLVGISANLTIDIDIHPSVRVPGNIVIPIKTVINNLGTLLKESIVPPTYGMSFKVINGPSSGHTVTEVKEGSAAYKVGIKSGDVVLGVNGKMLSFLPALYKEMWAAKGPIRFLIVRNDSYKIIEIVGETTE